MSALNDIRVGDLVAIAEVTMRKELGKIVRASFGFGGYQDAQIGLSLTFEGPGWGVCHFDGHWSVERTDRSPWTEHDRLSSLGRTVMGLARILKKAKKKSVAELAGVPVEVTFNGNVLDSWRILEEVL